MSLTPRLDRIDQNILINGNFQYWQRGTSGTIGYVADRWLTGGSGTSTTRQTGGPSDRSQYFQRISGSSINTVATQRIESLITRMITTNQVTISFYAKSPSGTPDMKFSWATASTADAFGTLVDDSEVTLGVLSTSWQRFTYTFDVTTSMRTNGFVIRIGDKAPPGAIEFDIAEVMLVCGERAAEFAYAGKNAFEEFKLCQRYYQRDFRWTNTSSAYSATAVAFRVTLFHPMRANPTVTQIAGTSLTSCLDRLGGGPVTPTSITLSRVNNTSFAMDFGGIGSGAAYQPYTLILDIVQADAEL